MRHHVLFCEFFGVIRVCCHVRPPGTLFRRGAVPLVLPYLSPVFSVGPKHSCWPSKRFNLLLQCCERSRPTALVEARRLSLRRSSSNGGKTMAAAAATTPFLRNYTRILVASADSSFRRRLISHPAYARTLREEAIGGAHALAKLAQISCDGVLLDRNLPDLDAAEVADLMREKIRASRSSSSIRSPRQPALIPSNRCMPRSSRFPMRTLRATAIEKLSCPPCPVRSNRWTAFPECWAPAAPCRTYTASQEWWQRATPSS